MKSYQFLYAAAITDLADALAANLGVTLTANHQFGMAALSLIAALICHKLNKE